MRRIFGSGEMADRTRTYDWASTSLGAIEQWPEVLFVSVNTVLNCRHPMLLLWGDDLVQFYNDAFRPSIREDKHPAALGQKARECWPEIWHIIGPQIDAVMQRGEASWYENALVPIFRDGKLEDVYWTYSYSPVADSTGRVRGTLVVCTDTTQTVRATRQMEREMDRLADLFDEAPAFFAVLSGPDFIFEMLNQQYQMLIGARDVLGKPVTEAVPEAEAQGFLELLTRVYRSGTPFVGHNVPIQLRRGPGGSAELRYLNFVYQPRREADGTISGIVAFGVDVTETKRAEQVLVQSEKLAVVGRLASSIAHEINNPLEAVTNLIFLARTMAVNPQAIEYLEIADRELQRMAAITNQTLRFHRQATKARWVPAAELIESVLPLYKPRLPNARVSLERRDRSVRLVHCMEGEIRQVLSNLIGNAMDAMSTGGGRLLIRTSDVNDVRAGGKAVALTIADTGSGIAPESFPRIFEAFYTTKGHSGTGLGLWISHEIVQRHGGTLRVRSRQGPGSTGTVFRMVLPCEMAADESGEKPER